ncbi:MAG: peptide ABC transporter substrate-binding protein [Hyphomicrobiales bacterium]|nr:peptide ABC transporter substrate-binding protein [Hyphomicrobiales bacterium]
MGVTRIAAGLLAALALVLALAAPAAAKGKDELVIGITQFPSTFHPNIDAMMAKSYILAFTRRPLTAYDKDWKLVCLLCAELPTMDNGQARPETTADGKRGVAVTYRIRAGATWGDGTPVTARDVLFTWNVGRHPKSGVGSRELYRRITAIDVVDDRTFTVHADKLDFQYNNLSGLGLLPAHLEEKAFADSEAYRTRTTFDTDTTNPGLYYGPYRITKVETGSHVVLEPNPTWWGRKPHFRRIVVRVVGNTAALEANLLSGAMDMIAGELGLTIDQALAFEKRHGDRYDVIYKPGLIYEHIDLNLDNPVLADKRVRQALLMALDRAALSQQLFEGRQPVAHTNVSPLDWVFHKGVRTYAFDPKGAAALLDAAGWKTKRRGIRHDGKGQPLSLEIMTTAGNRSRELVEQVLQSQWRQAGIEVKIRNQPARVFFGQTVTERKFPAMAMFAWISSPESVPRTTLHSAEIPSAGNGLSGQNYTGFRNAEVDRLIDEIELELDRAKRLALWHRLQDIYADELPALPLYFRAEPYILPKWLRGLTPTGHQFPSSLWAEDWTAE